MEGSQKKKDMFGGKELTENYIFLNQHQVDCVTQAKGAKEGKGAQAQSITQIGNKSMCVILSASCAVGKRWREAKPKVGQREDAMASVSPMVCTDAQDPVAAPWRCKSS